MNKMYLATAFVGSITLLGCGGNDNNSVIDDSEKDLDVASVSGKVLLEEEVLRLENGFHLREFPAEALGRDTDLTCIVAKGSRQGYPVLAMDCNF